MKSIEIHEVTKTDKRGFLGMETSFLLCPRRSQKKSSRPFSNSSDHLEGEKRYADRQSNVQRQKLPMKQSINLRQEKRKVFEYEKNADVI